jgi:7-keto-8-aminopelargonate synthetase-like enzyme
MMLMHTPCIIDGVRLHMGKRFTYKHNDIGKHGEKSSTCY